MPHGKYEIDGRQLMRPVAAILLLLVSCSHQRAADTRRADIEEYREVENFVSKLEPVVVAPRSETPGYVETVSAISQIVAKHQLYTLRSSAGYLRTVTAIHESRWPCVLLLQMEATIDAEEVQGNISATSLLPLNQIYAIDVGSKAERCVELRGGERMLITVDLEKPAGARQDELHDGTICLSTPRAALLLAEAMEHAASLCEAPVGRAPSYMNGDD